MLQPRRQEDLAAEPVDGDGRSHLLGKHLHRDMALQGIIERDEHARHAAPLELTLDGVGGPEGGAELVDEGRFHVVAARRSTMRQSERAERCVRTSARSPMTGPDARAVVRVYPPSTACRGYPRCLRPTSASCFAVVL